MPEKGKSATYMILLGKSKRSYERRGFYKEKKGTGVAACGDFMRGHGNGSIRSRIPGRHRPGDGRRFN